MGRPKNLDHKRLIAEEAYRLFILQGYNKTSYTDIANKSGMDRALVQYYFPKKELLVVEFMSKLLSMAETVIELRGLKSNNSWIDMYLIGQIHFSFLLSDENLAKFTLDIVSSRTLTQTILIFDESWAFHFLNIHPSEQDDVSDNLTIAAGGAYEMIYRYLISGKSLPVSRLMKRTMLSFINTLDENLENSPEFIFSYSLNEQTLTDINKYLRESFF